jgi:HD-GYP domain-containing protein (c-di-GMP phosphodiesterase class II)
MYTKITVNLGNLVLSLSDALDLAFPSLAMHQQRTAFVAWEMGKAARLDEKRIENVFLAGLLHDIGALSIEEKLSLHESETTNVRQHCVRGEYLFQSNPWLAPGAELVRHHHREWVNWDEPIDTPRVFGSQLLYLADFLERQIERRTYILHQDGMLRNKIRDLAGRQVHHDVVDLFMDLSRREEFWLDLTSPRLYPLLLHNGPFQTIEVDMDNIGTFAKLLSMIVDFKSPFTAAHSAGVSRCAMTLAGMVGMSRAEVEQMEVAGLLHDLGKLVVPNGILEKPAGLSAAEMAVVKQHTYYTLSILSTIRGLETIAEWGAYHHERLDGNGYPFKLNADGLNIGARIMAVSDIFTAMSEDRPYRRGMKPEIIRNTLSDLAARGIQDSRIVNILLDNMDVVAKAVTERRNEACEFYRNKV